MIVTTDILQGWNAIADFLACDVRTAKRWEQHRGLPIRRMRRTPGEGRPNVYALISELEQWQASAASYGSAAELELDVASEATGQVRDADSALSEPLAPRRADLPPQPIARESRRISSVVLFGVIAIVVTTTALAVWPRGHGMSATATRAGHGETATSNANHAIVAAGASGRHAEDLYLHGSYLFEQRTPETLQQAKTDFEQAIAAKPNYAPAYAGLAKVYDLLREYSMVPSDRAYPLAKQAAQRAIALDPKLPDAHAALGYEEFFWEWDGADAEREFQEAIALDPNSVTARHWYGAMLMHQARYKEAIEQLDRAQVLEPASAAVLGTRAYAIALSGRHDEAADLLQDILTRVPNSAPLHFILAQVSLQEPRDIPRYLDQMRRYAQLRHSDEELEILNAMEPAYERLGEAAMWRAMLETEQRRHPAPGHPTYQMAQCEVALGMTDAALRDLEELERDHNELMIGLDVDAVMNRLHGNARFERIVSQVGLPHVGAKSEPAQLPG
jgi:tetratricopeptide (TPR) repeat protein